MVIILKGFLRKSRIIKKNGGLYFGFNFYFINLVRRVGENMLFWYGLMGE